MKTTWINIKLSGTQSYMLLDTGTSARPDRGETAGRGRLLQTQARPTGKGKQEHTRFRLHLALSSRETRPHTPFFASDDQSFFMESKKHKLHSSNTRSSTRGLSPPL